MLQCPMLQRPMLSPGLLRPIELEQTVRRGDAARMVADPGEGRASASGMVADPGEGRASAPFVVTVIPPLSTLPSSWDGTVGVSSGLTVLRYPIDWPKRAAAVG